MPHSPYWLRDLATIERTLAAIADPILDRRAIERLFHVSRPVAGRIMREIGAVRAGNGNVVVRRQALAWVRKLARSDGFEYESRRIERIGEHLAEASRTIAARSVELPAPRAADGLPPNVELSAGRLTVTFETAPELLGALQEIVLAAARDWLAFQATCEIDPAEARRQSLMLRDDPQEKEILDWIDKAGALESRKEARTKGTKSLDQLRTELGDTDE